MTFGYDISLEGIESRRRQRKAERDTILSNTQSSEKNAEDLYDKWSFGALCVLVLGIGLAIFHRLDIGLIVVVLAFCVQLLALERRIHVTTQLIHTGAYLQQLYMLEIRDELLEQMSKTGRDRLSEADEPPECDDCSA